MSSTRGVVFNAYFRVENVEECNKLINEKFNSTPVKWYRGQLENSGINSNTHLQIVWGYQNQRYLTAVQKFFNSPNVQITKDPAAMIQYCTDEKKRLLDSAIYIKGDYDVKKCNTSGRNEIILKAEETGNFKDAMKMIKDWDVSYYIFAKKSLTEHFKSIFGMKDEVRYAAETFTMPLVDEEILKTRTIVITGPSGCGKTSWALAHFKHPVLIKNKADFTKISEYTDGIILDDNHTCDWKTKTLIDIITIDRPIHQDVKYGSVYVDSGMPRFIIINTEKQFWPKELRNSEGKLDVSNQELYDAIQRRCYFVKVTKPLYKATRRHYEEMFLGEKFDEYKEVKSRIPKNARTENLFNKE